MNEQWSLEEIYHGYDDPNYQADFVSLDDAIAALRASAQNDAALDLRPQACAILDAMEAYTDKIDKLSGYVFLRLATNATESETLAQYQQLMLKDTASTLPATMARKVLAKIDLQALALWAKEDARFADYAFMLAENREKAAHMLSDELEETIDQMNMTGGRAWSRLQSHLTSTLKVNLDGKTVTLSDVRNLAYSDDAQTRKKAYDAELKSYPQIDQAVAFALNNIKAQVTLLARKRGYASPLALTLAQSRMKRETLDAMLQAITEYLPVFHRYLKAKAKLLGHPGGLPWYDLFAPVGSCDGQYDLQKAKTLLTQTFEGFDPDMAQMMRRAFDESWIDFYSRPGKEGGAFCAEVHCLKQSRILTNYDGTLGDVQTLAHELGHAYHNLNIFDHRSLNRGYTMPVAETASTFNETYLNQQLLKDADAGLRLFLLERCLSDTT